MEYVIKEALQILAERRGEALARNIEPIILSNLNRGRLRFFLNKENDCQPHDYVWRVADCYERWYPHVYKVQVEKVAEVWEPLIERLQKWAYNFMRRHRFSLEGDRVQHAVDCATETAMVIVNASFPYDVDFDPWACVTLQHVCRKYIARKANPISIPDKELINVEEWDGWLRNVLDPASLETEERLDLYFDLLAAVEQLPSEARKQFILLYYFEQNTFEQIAVKLGKRVNALYKLHSDALKNLKQILSDGGYRT